VRTNQNLVINKKLKLKASIMELDEVHHRNSDHCLWRNLEHWNWCWRYSDEFVTTSQPKTRSFN